MHRYVEISTFIGVRFPAGTGDCERAIVGQAGREEAGRRKPS